MQAAFSFRPRLLLWTGLSGVVAWTLGFLWIVTRPETIVLPGSGRAAQLPVYFDRNFASLIKYENEIIVFLLVSAGLALLVRRSRLLVAERAEAERARGNLSRYFSPKVVDTLAERDEPQGRVRRQAVGVLFADLVGFTTMAEDMTIQHGNGGEHAQVRDRARALLGRARRSRRVESGRARRRDGRNGWWR